MFWVKGIQALLENARGPVLSTICEAEKNEDSTAGTVTLSPFQLAYVDDYLLVHPLN